MLRSLCLVTLVLSCSPVTAKFKSTGIPEYDSAIRKAVEHLKSTDRVAHKEESLVAYALFKAGEPLGSLRVKTGLDAAIGRATNGQYEGYDHLYLAGVDAMLLADVNSSKYASALQNIADYVAKTIRPDGSFSDGQTSPADTSMTQYALLATWAAKRAGCRVDPALFDRAAAWHASHGNNDGGYAYRPGQPTGDGKGNSSHTMTVAAAGSLGLSRAMLFGKKQDTSKPEAKFGVLEKVEIADLESGGAFPGYKPGIKQATLDDTIRKALQWNEVRYRPVSTNLSRLYFYYALERAFALNDVKTIKGIDWYRAYGDGVLSLQQSDGSFSSFTGKNIPTSFAILFFVRSTEQIMVSEYGPGVQISTKGGLESLFGDRKSKKPIQPLDELLAAIDGASLESLDESTLVDLVSAVQVGKKEDLIGQVDKLRRLSASKNAEHRRIALFAIGRTSDLKLVPLVLEALRDPNVDVNVEALQAMRYIARRPNGFKMSLNPLEGVDNAPEAEKLKRVAAWRTQAFRKWGRWYRQVRPYEDRDGIDDLELSGVETP